MFGGKRRPSGTRPRIKKLPGRFRDLLEWQRERLKTTGFLLRHAGVKEAGIYLRVFRRGDWCHVFYRRPERKTFVRKLPEIDIEDRTNKLQYKVYVNNLEPEVIVSSPKKTLTGKEGAIFEVVRGAETHATAILERIGFYPPDEKSFKAAFSRAVQRAFSLYEEGRKTKKGKK